MVPIYDHISEAVAKDPRWLEFQDRAADYALPGILVFLLSIALMFGSDWMIRNEYPMRHLLGLLGYVGKAGFFGCLLVLLYGFAQDRMLLFRLESEHYSNSKEA